MHSVEFYGDCRELARALRIRPVDALVLDAVILEQDVAVWAAISRFESLPLILYSGLDRRSLVTILRVNRSRTPLLVLRHLEDSPLRLQAFLHSLMLPELNGMILNRLAGPLGVLPPEIATTIAVHFSQAELGRTVQWLASTSGFCRRTFERWVSKTGLASARLVAMAPLITRAYCYLRDPGYTVGDVAAKIGVGSRHTLLNELRLFFGANAIAAIRDLSPTDFVGNVAKVLVPYPEVWRRLTRS